MGNNGDFRSDGAFDSGSDFNSGDTSFEVSNAGYSTGDTNGDMDFTPADAEPAPLEPDSNTGPDGFPKNTESFRFEENAPARDSFSDAGDTSQVSEENNTNNQNAIDAESTPAEINLDGDTDGLGNDPETNENLDGDVIMTNDQTDRYYLADSDLTNELEAANRVDADSGNNLNKNLDGDVQEPIGKELTPADTHLNGDADIQETSSGTEKTNSDLDGDVEILPSAVNDDLSTPTGSNLDGDAVIQRNSGNNLETSGENSNSGDEQNTLDDGHNSESTQSGGADSTLANADDLKTGEPVTGDDYIEDQVAEGDFSKRNLAVGNLVEDEQHQARYENNKTIDSQKLDPALGALGTDQADLSQKTTFTPTYPREKLDSDKVNALEGDQTLDTAQLDALEKNSNDNMVPLDVSAGGPPDGENHPGESNPPGGGGPPTKPSADSPEAAQYTLPIITDPPVSTLVPVEATVQETDEVSTGVSVPVVTEQLSFDVDNPKPIPSSQTISVDNSLNDPDKEIEQKPELPDIATFSENEQEIPLERVRVEYLEPNTSYYKSGYSFRTDDAKRPIFISGNLDLKEGEERNSKLATEVTDEGLSSDDAGHLIGKQFGGPYDAFNLVPQDSQLNRAGGEWYKMESEWKDALKDDIPVQVLIEPVYEGDSKRPVRFDVVYQVGENGPITTKHFENKPLKE